jgi:hypothetical protein
MSIRTENPVEAGTFAQRCVAVLAGAAIVVAMFASVEPAFAKRKHHPMANEICFNVALSKDDQAACKKQISEQTTAEGRSRVQKVFKRKAAEAKAASALPPK